MINRKVQYYLGQFFVQDSTKCLWQKYKKVTNPDFFHDYVFHLFIVCVTFENVTFLVLINTCVIYSCQVKLLRCQHQSELLR